MDKGTDYVALACLYGGYYAMLLIMCIFILPVLPFLWALKGKWYNPWEIAKEAILSSLLDFFETPSQTPPSKTDEIHDAKEDLN